MAITGISSIHLLRTFIESGAGAESGTRYTVTGIILQTVIHTALILSTLGIARISQPPIPAPIPEKAAI
jgi:hypothetical protein